MHIREFEFDLPSDLVAQEPSPKRDDARLMYLPRDGGQIGHFRITDLPRLLRPGDLIVVNDTRVFPARLLGHRVPSGGAVEALLVGREHPSSSPAQLPAPTQPSSKPGGSSVEYWRVLVHPGQKLKPGARVIFAGEGAGGVLQGEVVERHSFGRRLLRLWTEDGRAIDEVVDAIGHVPLPPYIKRPDANADRDRYQTVFARERGSVAAPTAGLHFSPALIDALRAAGVEITSITLHVGYGTFQPVRVDEVENHRLESERYDVSAGAAHAVTMARREGRRVIAVGTTTIRTLEAVARGHDGQVVAGSGWTDLFIHPGVYPGLAHSLNSGLASTGDAAVDSGRAGFDFRVTNGLVTNFHVPRSSLLMLVCAFGGCQRVMTAYRTAVAERYRFYSYGDAMLIL